MYQCCCEVYAILSLLFYENYGYYNKQQVLLRANHCNDVDIVSIKCCVGDYSVITAHSSYRIPVIN
jgi:hypothetical protein